MDILQAIILGIVQGATEFVPISSSAHLVLVPAWLGWDEPGLAFISAIHLGTLLAVLVYFWRDWLRVIQGALRLLRTRSLADPDSKLFGLLVIGSIPAGVVGLLLKDFFERTFEDPVSTAWSLLITAALLIFSERYSQRANREMNDITWFDSFLIGLTQMVAIFPGISRSGSTIAAGLARGINRADAARFSFLLGTPAILAAGLLGLFDAVSEGGLGNQMPIVLGGFISAMIVGYLSIAFLLAYLKKRKLYGFAVYCVVFGLASLVKLLSAG